MQKTSVIDDAPSERGAEAARLNIVLSKEQDRVLAALRDLFERVLPGLAIRRYVSFTALSNARARGPVLVPVQTPVESVA